VLLVDMGQGHNPIHDSPYESHWGLRLRPFENVPDPRLYVPSVQHEAAMERLLYGIHARKGIVC
jgi:general secretion pathway protein A